MTELRSPGRGLASGTHVTTQVVGHRAVLSVAGEIDMATIETLARFADGAIDERAGELWIDLSETTFMDSTGVHLLVDLRRRLAELNRRLAIICPAGQVRRLFDLADASGVLPLFDDRSSAHQAG